MEKKSATYNLQSPISIGFSPCPNDCFIFDAIVHNRIDTEGLNFRFVMEDVEALNKKAFHQEIDVTKLSYYAYAHLTTHYVLLDAGSALGNKCGPLLISKVKHPSSQIPALKIAIPGKYTTANLLFSLAFPTARNKVEMIFSDIENAVLSGKVDAGLIIHENRFTYKDNGLKKNIDLGEFWEKLTKAPIPLGGIVVKRNLPTEQKQKINRILKRSVKYALNNPLESLDFIKANAQEMSQKVIYKHINLYVNKFSVDLGEEGRGAVELLFEKAAVNKLIPEIKNKLMI